MEKGNALLCVFKFLGTQSLYIFLFFFSVLASEGFICIRHHDDPLKLELNAYRQHMCAVLKIQHSRKVFLRPNCMLSLEYLVTAVVHYQ